MASNILRSNNVRAVHALGLLCLVLLVQKGAAFTFTVGGRNGYWSVPSDPNSNPYNQWAEKNRFQIGNSIEFKYPAGQDSVLRVKEEDYTKCNTDAPIAKYSNGSTVFPFDNPGPYYFISGNKDNCNKNEKLVVIVLADRSKRNSNQTSSPPSPSPEMAPSPTPIAHEIQSPSPLPSSSPPTGQVTPSSPPTEQATPSPPSTSPATTPPPPNAAASSVIVSFAGVGAFIVSSLGLSF